LGEIGEIITGKTPLTREPKNFGGYFPFITIPDLKDQRFILKTERTISDIGAQKMKNLKLPANAVVMSCLATVGETGITTKESFTNQQINSIICDPQSVDYRFVYYVFRRLKRRLQKYDGSVYTNISKSKFADTEIEIPSIGDQKRIADILCVFDDKIELNNKISRTLEQIAQAIFKEWFVNFKFPGHEKVKMVDSELGKIPEGWEAKSWGELESESLAGDWGDNTESTEAPRKAYILRGTDIPALQAGSKGECPIRYLSDDSLERRKLKPGDIVIEISGGSKGQPTGRSIFITQEILNRFELPLVCTSFCRSVRGNGILAPILMYLHLFRLYQTKKIWNYQLQSTGISNFQYGQFNKYERLVIPDKIIQEKIADTLYSYIEYGHLNENQKLAALRDLLLPRLMRGELRV